MNLTKGDKIIWIMFFFAAFVTRSLAQPGHPANHEKIYIQYDKAFYSAGEMIWFKAYVYNNGFPSLLSDELFLQLEDNAGKIISKKKYPLQGATAAGNMALDDTLPEGNYSIKAITKTIASDSAMFMYTKNLFIYHPVETTKNTSAKKTISLQFFPESGHLIERIKTQVAFKATDERGDPVNVSGFIKSDSATVLAPFISYHDGIGKVSFTPHLSDRLFAEVELNGNKYHFPLPAVEESGIYLKIADADSGKSFEIVRSKKSFEMFDTIKLVAKMNDDTVFENTISFGNEQIVSGLLRTKNISSGILHFLILNKDGVPLAERLSFVNNGEYLSQPDLMVIKRDSSRRAVNIFELTFSDTVPRSLSIAVTDISTQDFPDKENICSGLLLTSDLRGHVYNPAYYFETGDAIHKLALDNLMLTHGWTRYNITKKVNNQANQDDHYLIAVSGTVTEAATGKAVWCGTLSLRMITEDSSFQSYDITVEKNGKFKMDSLLFFGNAKIFYSYSNNNSRQLVNIHFDKDAGDKYFAILKTTVNESTRSFTSAKYLRDEPMPVPGFMGGRYKQLETVFLRTKLKRPEEKINEQYATPLFRGSGRIVLDNIDRPYNNTTEDVITYALTNILTLKYDGDLNSLVNRKNFSILTQKNWLVGLLVDETPSGLDAARTITMGKVALIKFYEAGFVGVGTQSPGGALAIYLKKFDDEQLRVDNNGKYFVYKGYDVTEEFYHPVYTGLPATNANDDTHLTLYWHPVLLANSSRNIKFNFLNNDISGKINIRVEGFDALGRLIHYEKTF